VLVAVDQLEEAFTQGAGEAERQHFLHMLLAAVDDPLDPVRVVVTVRDDFVGKLAGLRALFVVKKLGVDDLRRTITGPLARYDYRFDDPAIVDDLIAEVGSAEAGNLPLLQFACRTLWDGRDAARRRLLRATYREMGGLAGALARHADHALAELSPDEHRTARQLLLQLVVGTTRRSVARDQLVAGAGANADAVLDRLLSARLLVQRNHGDGEAPILEIAHESLVHTWSQLARWLDESREEVRLLEELGDAVKLWERRGKRSEDTWSAADLAASRHRAAQLDVALPPRIQEFFAAGDRQNRLVRRRRRIRIGIAVAAGALVTVLVLLKVVQDRWRDELIRHNLGTVDFEITAFDWRGGAAVLADLGQVPRLELAVYGASADDTSEPGAPFPDKLVRIENQGSSGAVQTWRVSAPGGVVFLKLDGRGRSGDRCPPSWVRIQAFPGYRVDDVKRIELSIPTCQATLADMVEIDEGPFWYGGPGDPPSRYYGDPDYTEPRRQVTIGGFAIDRTEVSNAAFARFARLEKITGYARPIYSTEKNHARDGDPAYPVSDVDAFEAAAYCAYMGKRLPSELQWTKAARGGLSINGVPNPMPERLYPWGNVEKPDCVNRANPQDGKMWMAPVDSFSCGASPYGVLHLVGNVQEWIARDGQSDRDNPLHALRGGAADAPASLEQTTTIYRNHREPRSLTYANGIRCVVVTEGTRDQK
jgi:formylglycine-generating enzyme required for sulfatase activity